MDTIYGIIPDSLWVALLGGGIVIVIGSILGLYMRRARRPRPAAGRKKARRAEKEHERKASTLSSTAAIRLLDTQSGKSWAIDYFPVTIGRGSENAVILQDGTVSQNHANIYFDTALHCACIEDIGSENGIFINGYPTCRNTLQERDKIAIGNQDLVFQQGASNRQKQPAEIKRSE